MASNMSENKLLNILTDMKHYHKGYAEYCRKTTKWQELQKWTECAEFESNVVTNLSKKLSGQMDQQIRVLGVGSGDGILEIYQLQKLAAKFPKISASVVEPSELITKYKDTAGRNPVADNITFEWHHRTFDEYLACNGYDKKYHFISVVHAVYFLGDPEVFMKKLYKLLEPGGVLLLILLTDHTGSGSIPLHQSGLKDDTTTNNFVNSSQVKATLEKLQIEYTQSMYTESTDITDFITNDNSEEGDLLLDFLTYTINFKKSAPDDVRDRMMHHFKQGSRIEKTGDGDEKIYFKATCDILFVTKREYAGEYAK
ncbi:histamine N-methyltransferase A-like [Amphiura filiformis]|uniref:histamine N-methyltransferase A-like n=1 Tax=Amphiura filiformis TaxID=82378 RepID=UPI003B220AC4